MARTESHKAPVDALTASLTEALGENLISCVIYSEDARGTVPPDPTKIGIFVILNDTTPITHAAIMDAIDGRIHSDPVIAAKMEIERNIRMLAVELRRISRNYRVLAGEDPFEVFELDPETANFLIDRSRRDFRVRSARPAPAVGKDDIRHV